MVTSSSMSSRDRRVEALSGRKQVSTSRHGAVDRPLSGGREGGGREEREDAGMRACVDIYWDKNVEGLWERFPRSSRLVLRWLEGRWELFHGRASQLDDAT